MMLTASRLERLRSYRTTFLPATCTVQRAATVSDGGGGTTTTWGDHLVGVPCLLAPLGGGEGGGSGSPTTGGRISDETTGIVTLPAGTDARSADRLVIDGVVYEVTQVRRRTRSVSLRLEVKEAP